MNRFTCNGAQQRIVVFDTRSETTCSTDKHCCRRQLTGVSTHKKPAAPWPCDTCTKACKEGFASLQFVAFSKKGVTDITNQRRCNIAFSLHVLLCTSSRDAFTAAISCVCLEIDIGAAMVSSHTRSYYISLLDIVVWAVSSP